MSEIITIDTGETLVKPVAIEPLPLYSENYFMLSDKMPDYTDPLPNTYMNNLVERLKMTMKKYNGIGLSANQCGVAARVFVIGYEDFFMACINPKVVRVSEKNVADNEGCLSFPGLYCKIARPEEIDVEFTTPSGDIVNMHLEGLTARCFLHELDHMNGIEMVDRVGPVALRMARQKQQKRIKSIKRRMKK